MREDPSLLAAQIFVEAFGNRLTLAGVFLFLRPAGDPSRHDWTGRDFGCGTGPESSLKPQGCREGNVSGALHQPGIGMWRRGSRDENGVDREG